MNKLSERLKDAYMVGNKELIDELLKEAQARTGAKKTRITPIKINTVLNDEYASPVKVYNFLNQVFGEDWWEWEFPTIEKMLWVRFGVVLEDINRDKIWAIKHLCDSQRPFLDWHEFNAIALSFGSAINDFLYLKRPTPGMVINAVKSMKHIRPDEPFSVEVKAYICFLLIDDGIYVPPPSIADLIKNEYKLHISAESAQMWADTIKRFRAIIGGKNDNEEETPENIQAKRLVRAEMAAQKYGK